MPPHLGEPALHCVPTFFLPGPEKSLSQDKSTVTMTMAEDTHKGPHPVYF